MNLARLVFLCAVVAACHSNDDAVGVNAARANACGDSSAPDAATAETPAGADTSQWPSPPSSSPPSSATSPMIADDDPRFVWRIDPARSFTDSSSTNAFLVHTFDAWSFMNGGASPQFGSPTIGDFANESFTAYATGLTTLARRSDSTNGNYFAHYVSDRTEAVHWPGTYRSELTAPEADSTSLVYGNTYWVAYGVKLNAAAADAGVSILDFHTPNGSVNVGPGVVSLTTGGGNITMWRSWNASQAYAQTGCAPTSFDVRPCDVATIASGVADTWIYIVMRISMGWSDANEGLKVWVAREGEALQQVYAKQGGVGYNEPSLPQFVYPKFGIYKFMGAPSAELTSATRGAFVVREAAGPTELGADAMLSLVRR